MRRDGSCDPSLCTNDAPVGDGCRRRHPSFLPHPPPGRLPSQITVARRLSGRGCSPAVNAIFDRPSFRTAKIVYSPTPPGVEGASMFRIVVLSAAMLPVLAGCAAPHTDMVNAHG